MLEPPLYVGLGAALPAAGEVGERPIAIIVIQLAVDQRRDALPEMTHSAVPSVGSVNSTDFTDSTDGPDEPDEPDEPDRPGEPAARRGAR